MKAWQYNINVTRRCNLRCGHCFIPPALLGGFGTDIAEDTLMAAGRQIAEHAAALRRADPSWDGVRVQILGGEPLLLDATRLACGVATLRAACAALNVPLHLKIATNLAATGRQDHLLDLFDGVSTSWDLGRFPNAAAEARWTERVHALAQAGKPPSVEVTLTHPLVDLDPVAVARPLLELGVVDLHFSPFIPRGWLDDAAGGDTPSEWTDSTRNPALPRPQPGVCGAQPHAASHERTSRFLIALAQARPTLAAQFPAATINPVDSLVAILSGGGEGLEGGCTEFTCPIHSGMLNIDWDGRVSGCTNDGGGPEGPFGPQKPSGGGPAGGAVDEFGGSLLDQPLSAIYDSPALTRRRIEAMMPHRACGGCDEFRVCAGGCSLIHRRWNGRGECPGPRSFIKAVRRMVEDGVLPVRPA